MAAALTAAVISSRYSWVVAIITTLFMLAGSIASIWLLITVWDDQPYTLHINWFTMADQTIAAGILVDNLSALMMMLISTISFLVHLYSSGYMAADSALKRYFAMLGFFTFAMLGLVLADNLLLIFVFWELIGFSSYLLIGHWTEQPGVATAATKAFLINRIGDIGFLAGLFIIWSNTGTFSIAELGGGTETFSWQTSATLCLLWGAIGKSAQFPLFTWLPDAMAGPTPVSALIHAATMVAAGVFLLARTYFLFTPEALLVVTIIGTITALAGGLAALGQYDIKKILAYSTISQLGLMVIAIGVGSGDAFMLHLFTHAFFKAGLFLAAGSVIHTLEQAWHSTNDTIDIQDIRHLGGLKKFLPITFIVFVVCGASLAGVPLFSGFLSKEAIISQTLNWAGEDFSWRWIIPGAVFLSSMITVLYIFRLIWYVFIRKNTALHWEKITITEAPAVMRIPMLVLAACSIWWVVSPNPIHISGWIHPEEHTTPMLSIISTVWVLLALVIGYTFFKKRGADDSGISSSLYHGFYLDILYQQTIVRPINKLSAYAAIIDLRLIDRFLHFVAYAQATLAHLAGWADRAFIDGAVKGSAKVVRGIGQLTRSFQGGKIQHYLFWSVLGLILIFLLVYR